MTGCAVAPARACSTFDVCAVLSKYLYFMSILAMADRTTNTVVVAFVGVVARGALSVFGDIAGDRY